MISLLFTLLSIACAETVSGTATVGGVACLKFTPTSAAKKDRTYNDLKTLLEKNKIPDEEILARLIASETKAAGESCQTHQTAIAQNIASALYNRIQKRNRRIDSVVFQAQQFASSLHFYKESQIAEFLCPTDSNLISQTLDWTRSMKNKTYVNTLPENAVNYYLYKHSTRFTPPSWTKTYKEAPTNPKISHCIRFFENSHFK